MITIKDNGKKKTSALLKECKKLFPVWCAYSDLDKDFPPVKTEYTYEMTQEPPEEYANMSANDLAVKHPEKHFMTLRERIIFELNYFKKTGKHLDVDSWTLCSGSRDSSGFVPGCRWDVSMFEVCRSVPGCSYSILRGRVAVSLISSSFNPSEITINNERYKLTKIL